MTQIIAIDWSGRDTGAAEFIWLARVVDDRLVQLDNGYERGAVIHAAIDFARSDPRTVVGLDFAFGFPAWYSRAQGWASGKDAWQAMETGGEELLATCEPPFWGRAGKHSKEAQELGPPLRLTEKGISAKSVFQIGGAGAVGTGSLRGMQHLAELSVDGFSIWPFDDPAWPLAVEIYPRLLTGNVHKNRHHDRRKYLESHFPEQDPVLMERAAGSEDAFDAAVSAMVMGEQSRDFDHLAAFDPHAPERLEGAIWRPPEVRARMVGELLAAAAPHAGTGSSAVRGARDSR